jgi:TonB-like protein
MKKTLLLLPVIVACLICPIVSGQEKKFVCRDHQSLWRDAQGKPYRLSSTQLEKLRIHCEAPKLSGQWCGRGKIMYQVVINAEGRIECAEALNGDGLADVRQLALDALKKWTFKPVKVAGKPIAALGIAGVDVSWGSDTCRSK